MSVHVMSWVFKHSEEDVPGRRLVLLALADKADHDGTGAYPAIATLAMETRMSERGVQYALRALESTGRIKRLGLHSQYGTNEYVVCMGVQSVQGRNEQQEGVQSDAETDAQIAPEPSLTATTQRQPSVSAPAHEAWPEKLQDTASAQEVLDTLIEVAHDHGAPPPTRKAVGHVLLAFPDRAHLSEAHAMASWFAGKQIKRVVPTYRNWLGNADPANTQNRLRVVKSTPQHREAASKASWQGWQEWAAEHVPDLPASKVISAATTIEYAGREVTPENVRARVKAVSS